MKIDIRELLGAVQAIQVPDTRIGVPDDATPVTPDYYRMKLEPPVHGTTRVFSGEATRGMATNPIMRRSPNFRSLNW